MPSFPERVPAFPARDQAAPAPVESVPVAASAGGFPGPLTAALPHEETLVGFQGERRDHPGVPLEVPLDPGGLGRAFRRVAHSGEALDALDAGFPGLSPDFQEGGCWVLAEAARRAIGGGDLYALVKADTQVPQHIVLGYQGLLFDSDGGFTPAGMVSKCEKDWAMRVSLVPFDPAANRGHEIQCPENAVTSLEAAFRKEAFGPERQTDSRAFRSWFGASKVVDSLGEPLVLAHGTPHDFRAFRASGTYGIWFACKGDPDVDVAILDEGSMARLEQIPSPDEDAFPSFPVGARSIPVYLRIENPAFLDGDYPDEGDLRAQGHDGVIYLDGDDEIAAAVVFSPEQIKSALGNCGAFDPLNPDIGA